MVDITVESVTRILVSAIEEYEPDEDEDEEDLEEPFTRTITIELASGEVIELDLSAASAEELELIED
jgi:hypothetical protein